MIIKRDHKKRLLKGRESRGTKEHKVLVLISDNTKHPEYVCNP